MRREPDGPSASSSHVSSGLCLTRELRKRRVNIKWIATHTYKKIEKKKQKRDGQANCTWMETPKVAFCFTELLHNTHSGGVEAMNVCIDCSS